MTAKTMLFGPLGRQLEIPAPEAGMAAVGVLDSEETTLVSGGLSVYRAPTTYKTYNMSWKGGTRGLSKNLQPIIDMHAGAYGRGPFYLTDPMSVDGNLLPTRWASSWQLAHLAGSWGRPELGPQSVTPEGEEAIFALYNATPVEGPVIAIPTIPGQPLYLKAWGVFSAGAAIQVKRLSRKTGLWETYTDYVPKMSGHNYVTVIDQLEGLDDAYSAVRLALVKPRGGGASIRISHMELATTPSETFRMGKGVGALQFTGNAAGNIDSALLDRIGLSIDLKEVQRDPRI